MAEEKPWQEVKMAEHRIDTKRASVRGRCKAKSLMQISFSFLYEPFTIISLVNFSDKIRVKSMTQKWGHRSALVINRGMNKNWCWTAIPVFVPSVLTQFSFFSHTVSIFKFAVCLHEAGTNIKVKARIPWATAYVHFDSW